MSLNETMSNKLQRSLAAIGRKNGLAAPASQDPADKLLHEYAVDTIAEAFFKKQREKSLKAVLAYDDRVPDGVESVVKLTKKHDQGSSVRLIGAQHYELFLDTKRGANRFDKDLLTTALRKRGWSAADVEALVTECTKTAEPQKSFRAVEKE